ncbi:DNA polymerase III subunit gamma/tau [Saprospiraceae bacterium]|nr:DNA polymerase III subunit gamma/tau [Saprospiraceae bacterium]MDB4824358.1 DNA polymerase III subunit gamma/tau [Saprospiraceae bacterium]MDB9914574.1 DNA polymerase III subunit gamma/tau [Saprospiraceae bacterium]
MSKFVVSARKYRPATFDEVIGQDHVAKTLKNALIGDKLAHAFLFCGPRGVGKTTCARILAKVINCENKINGVDPCNECGSCKSFSDSASFNIIELDAASNNSVEAIRTLIEQVRFQPQQGSHKVFIIDEVHMLSTAAFNAFLKTLEEPPPYAIFILATTEKHKILPTILSRCQIFDFKRIQISHIIQQLEHICKAENRTAEPEALQMIAQKADGAMRDALSIFDKIASASNDNITYQEVITQLNVLDYDYFFKMTDYLLREDFSQILLTLDDVMKQGFEVDLFIQGMSEHMRNLMVCRHPETLSILEISEGAMKRYHDQSMICTNSFLLSALNLLNQCDMSLSTASNKRLYAEIALSKICYLNRALEADLIPQSAGAEKKTLIDSVSQANVINAKALQAPASNTNTTIEEEETPEKSRPTSLNIAEDIKILVEEPTSQHASLPSAFETLSPVEPIVEKIELIPTSEPSVSTYSISSSEATPKVSIPTLKPNAIPAVKSVSSLSSLDSIMNTVKAEEQAKKEARKSMSIELVEKIWMDYFDKNESSSVKVAMKNSFRTLVGLTITVQVGSENGRNVILQEDRLKDQLREQLGAEDLILDVVVDKSLFPEVEQEKPKTLYNNREKYELMNNKNSQLSELRIRFDLKIDK